MKQGAEQQWDQGWQRQCTALRDVVGKPICLALRKKEMVHGGALKSLHIHSPLPLHLLRKKRVLISSLTQETPPFFFLRSGFEDAFMKLC